MKNIKVLFIKMPRLLKSDIHTQPSTQQANLTFGGRGKQPTIQVN